MRIAALSLRLVVGLSAVTFGGALVSCGGAKDSVTAQTPARVSADQIDADPVALLPSSPQSAAYLDAKAAFAAPGYGEALARLVDRLVPLGDETGFLPSRDAETLWAASYAGQGVDGLAVVRGKFDEAKLRAAAEKRAAGGAGSPIVASSYGERAIYTFSNVGVCVLTPRTALLGTETAIRRSIDRIQSGSLKRSVPGWMLETLATPSALFAGAGDFETQPIPSDLRLPVAWLKSVRTAKVVATGDNGVRVQGALKYATADEAGAAERGMKQGELILRALSITGAVPRLEDTAVKVEGTQVDASFRVDGRGVASLLENAGRFIPGLAGR